MAKMTLKEWNTVLKNLKEENEEIEVVWLESTNEYVLCHEYELFEDGFETERQAWRRLEEVLTLLENKVILSNLMNEFSSIQSTNKMLEKYDWYSLASGIKDNELTKKLMLEIIEEKTYLRRQQKESY